MAPNLNTDPPSSPHALPYQIAALVVLVLLAAFFAASEAALVSISRLRARAIAERRVRGAENLEQLVDDKTRFLTSILVGNTIVLLAADSLATYIALTLGLPSGAILSTVIMAAVFLLFGEIVPKTVATGDSERWALKLALPMRYASYVLTPIAKAFQVVTDLILSIFGMKNAHRPYVTEEDIRTLVNVGAEQRVIEEQERELIHSVMEFGDTIVREVMKPRPEMVAVSIEDSPRRALDVVIAEGYSKLPVYQESKDDIVGVIHDRELLVALANGSLARTTVRDVMRTAVHVPETKKIADLLREMQRDKFSLAIVVDEYGGTAGLVTMEDLLEEIVGEIRDEHDADEQESIAVVSEREAVVEAGTNIEDVNARLGTELPTEDFETIGGYTVGLFGRLPKEGEEIEGADHVRFRVDRTRGRRILSVRVYTNGSINREQESEDADAAARL
ncbi:MAG: HlyC/CorC family transporter [Candidatus Eremiobacteraeota bacterium]|nr:HlyC/CorC family transporter [Candidatus Eremiobacteraeota bacterium]